MKKFFIFFLGMLSSVAIVGAVAAWFLFFSPEARNKQQAPPTEVALPNVPSPPTAAGTDATGTAATTGVGLSKNLNTNFPVQGDLSASQSPGAKGGSGSVALYLQGKIVVPPELKKLIEKKPDLSMTVRVSPGVSGNGKANAIRMGQDILKVSFPYNFKFEVEPMWAEQFMKNEKFALFFRVVVCYDRGGKPCTGSQAPNLEGNMRVRIRVPGGLKNAAEVAIPTIIMNKSQAKVDTAACSQSGNTIGGVLQATEKYNKAGGSKKFMVVGMPLFAKRPPEPYAATVNEDGRHLSQEEAQNIAKFGIIAGPAQLDNGGKFSLKIPQEFVSEHYRLFANPCKDKESDMDCLKRAFPITYVLGPNEREREILPLVGKGFEIARCGMKDHVFFVHKWNKQAPRATESTVYESNPPEVIEGSVY